MRDKLLFQVRTLRIEEGFELSCDAILPQPLGPMRLIDAVIHATQLAERNSAQIEIFDCQGEVVETVRLNGRSVTHNYLTSVAA